MVLHRLHLKPLDISETVIVCIKQYCRPRLVLIPLLYAQYVLLKVVVRVRRGNIEVAVAEHHKYAVSIKELTQ